MTRRVLASVFFAMAAFALLANAEPPKVDTKKPVPEKDKLDIDSSVKDLASKQVRQQALFSDFKSALLRLSQRMAASPKPEDQERAKLLKQALEKANEEGIENSFDKLVMILKAANKDDQAGIEKAIRETDDLTKRLRAILVLLQTDNRDAELKRQIAEAQRRLEELKRLIREQETVRTNTELNRRDKDRLGQDQKKVTNDTDALAKGKAKGDQGGEGAKAGSKAGDGKGEGKPGESKGAGKNDTGEAKGGDKNEKKPATDPKEGQKGEGKNDGKKGDPKEGQKGESKDGGKGEPKEGQKGEGKGDPKQGGEPKGQDKQASKSDSKGKGDGKGEGKPSDSKSGGQQSQGGSKSSQGGQQAGGSKGSGQQQQQQQQKKDDQPDFPGKKQIQDAEEYQKKAENDIDKGNNDAAAKNQADATKKLEEAKKRLEELLRQLREEEVERILAALQGRCEKMLAMQKDVREGTVSLDKVMKDRGSPKIDPADAQRGLELSDKEKAIVKEADIAIDILRGEGSAVAFPAVFDFVRELMINVEKRLRKTDAGATTIATEDEIISSLEEMIDALKKARKENGQQQPGQPGGGGGQQNQPLLQEIQELKMIRNMQLRVNRMTETYGKEYKGEQSPAPEKATAAEKEKAEGLQKELKGLAERQEKIYEVTNDLYRGKNK
jgi:hypothetical protein